MTGGHLGFRKTVEQVARRAYWTGYRSDVQRFCRRCPDCTKYHCGAPPLVREQLGLVSLRSKQHYDLRVRPITYSEGQLVWVYHPRRRVGRSPKWQRWYTGPYVVEKAFSDVLYRVRRSPKAKPMIVHVDKMKTCLEPPSSSADADRPTAGPSLESSDGPLDDRPRREIRRPARYR